MTKKIFRSIVLIAAVVLMASLAVAMGVLYRRFTDQAQAALDAQMSLAAQGVEQSGQAYLDGLQAAAYRMTWIAADGRVLYDNQADPADMENHGEREEVREALAYGQGQSERVSATRATKTLYRAQRLTDGTVLRISVTQSTVEALVLGTVPLLLLVFAGGLILSALLARRLSRKVVDPLNRLDLESPLSNDTYEELAPLLTRIDKQQRQAETQMDTLRRKQAEFSAVTENMNEGLILLNDQGDVLSLNPAAARLFGVEATDRVGQSFLTVDRSLPVRELVRKAQAGEPGEMLVDRDGGKYQLNANPVRSNGQMAGVCILIFDVTAKALAEQQRREFSANVSHELKTPLHTIMGAVELLESGLVKPEDVPRFLGHIHQETTRLVTLVEDILRLSQLDEGMELPREKVDLGALIREVKKTLEPMAQAKHIQWESQGEGTVPNGVRRLLYEIVYNLCDNAIRYNVDGGRVTVSVEETPAQTVLTVADTGIGIPLEAQDRVFERFYRVNKSHSRETGGTGLGLSIVKHAAQLHNATIRLESKPGRGTRIRISFPAQ